MSQRNCFQRQILVPRREIEEEQQQHRLQECCQQLRQVEEPCRCKGIRKIAKEQRQRKQLQGHKLREIIQRA
ncbi:hypothetical protein MLD38_035242 [Melastoma candidum]|uniref:Uncharacterized protein n=1 Tax=Melastoma candidum TaxID=119954 RepID=A0ACB9MDQ4_9MYRT|nr:hypothetical protein MLD38_035242 [Melastoma candidum]